MKGKILTAALFVGLLWLGLIWLEDAQAAREGAPCPYQPCAQRALLPSGETAPQRAREETRALPQSAQPPYVCARPRPVCSSNGIPVRCAQFYRAAWPAFHLSDGAG